MQDITGFVPSAKNGVNKPKTAKNRASIQQKCMFFDKKITKMFYGDH
jgi:hypothetical protein